MRDGKMRDEDSRACRFAPAYPQPSDLIPPPSKGAGDLDDFVHFELIADLDVVEIPERKTALESGLDFPHVVLEPLERIELTGVYHHVVPQQAHLGIAPPHQPLDHIAARHRADAGDLERL